MLFLSSRLRFQFFLLLSVENFHVVIESLLVAILASILLRHELASVDRFDETFVVAVNIFDEVLLALFKSGPERRHLSLAQGATTGQRGSSFRRAWLTIIPIRRSGTSIHVDTREEHIGRV